MYASGNSRALPTPSPQAIPRSDVGEGRQGTPAYWRASRDAFALLGEVKAALDAFATACERFERIVATDAPEEDDGAEPEGGVGSWERAYAPLETAWLHPFAARVLHARGLVPGSAFCVVRRRLP